MAVRQIEPIDRAELRATIQKWIDAHTDVDDTDGVGLLEDVLWEINAQPTLTPPEIVYCQDCVHHHALTIRNFSVNLGGRKMVKAEIITMAKKAADAWRNTDTYHQAAQIIDMLVEELEQNLTLTPPNEPLTPCDVCRFSPPSSGDGKPCCLCPADCRPPEGDV